MDLDAYVAEHRGEWRRLDTLSRRRRRLSAAEADELVLLYQRVATHLSVVRSRTPDPALVAELSRLVLAARGAITGPTAFDWRSVPRFFTHSLPLSLYVARRWWIASALAFFAVSAILAVWVIEDTSVAAQFGLGAGEIQQLVEHDFADYYSEYDHHVFGTLVWTNNAWIALQCLASGVAILPVFWLLWQNALNLGLVGGIMIGHGGAEQFFGLIAPHGLLELTGIFVSAGIGLRLGWSWIVPSPGLSRGQSLAATAVQSMVAALGLVGVFAVAGFLESFVTPSPLPLLVRDAIGLVVWLAFLAYVFVLGARAQRAEAAAPESSELA
ncbi:stage II sporulation protein M [Catellatospora tritici]|uniref:stage II sporulation protein M n=1 Tax=Catellatospora tritici TaxID=2851566 RepID=UPI001C2D34BB|nr:stage II sporulation protein M [Catellatospora tritici]MBV1849482.1 stage II sporulation protein M [Catellatospora tritici]MBV1854054.1 stage II sporulation protein M [Catellatospora tritici]